MPMSGTVMFEMILGMAMRNMSLFIIRMFGCKGNIFWYNL
jgi:hypothetical protein